MLRLTNKKSLDKLVFKDGRSPLYENNGQLFFIAETNKGFTDNSNDLLINKIKIWFKDIPWIFTLLYYTMGASFVGKSARSTIKEVGDDKLVLNLGSGIKRVGSNVINVDFYPFAGVDIVADIVDLPLADNSVDAVVNEYVLEHVPNPARIVAEMFRILKPGGLVYVAVPFVASFHSSPNDYYRWSQAGLREMLRDFREVKMGVRCGPTAALVYVFCEWLATLLSFGVKVLQQGWFMLFMICLSPLKLIDYLIFRLPGSSNIAYGFYFIGKKE